MRMATRLLLCLIPALVLGLVVDAAAHGERAQQANVRMRTVNWYDIEIEPRNVMVGEEVRVSGRFRTSAYWPKNIAIRIGLESQKFPAGDSRHVRTW